MVKKVAKVDCGLFHTAARLSEHCNSRRAPSCFKYIVVRISQTTMAFALFADCSVGRKVLSVDFIHLHFHLGCRDIEYLAPQHELPLHWADLPDSQHHLGWTNSVPTLARRHHLNHLPLLQDFPSHSQYGILQN